MRKKILFLSATILFFLTICLIYLSIYGIKTNSFNNFINNKVKDYNSKLILQLDEVYIKLNFNEFAININAKNSNLIANSNQIKISNIDINLNLIKLFKNEKSIKNIKIKSSNNLIKDVTSFLNEIDYNLFRYIFYSQIKKGSLIFELDTKFDDIDKDIFFYDISGSVSNAKFNIPGYENLNDINFNFQTQNKLTQISNLNFFFENINFVSESLELKKDQSGSYNIKGDIENTNVYINPDLIFKFTEIKQDYLSNKDILFKSKNFFSFRLNENKKIKNLKINSVIKFDEIYFNEKYQNLIFLKEGTINSNLEDEQLTAEIQSKFVFSDDLKSNNDYKNNDLKLLLDGKKNQKLNINGTISNGKILIDPKIIFNHLKINAKVLSDQKINFQTYNNFKFEVSNGKIENYIFNSEINIDKLKFDKNIQDILYLKNIKSNLTFADKLLKVDLNCNYSFFDKNLNNDSDRNIINFKLDKNNSEISSLELFVQSDNNFVNLKELKKYLNFKNQDSLIDDQIINLDSNIKIKALIDDKFDFKYLDIKSNLNFDNLNVNYKSNIIKKYIKNYEDKILIKNPKIIFEYSNDLINFKLDGKYYLKDKEDNIFIKLKGNRDNFELYSFIDLDNIFLKIDEIQYIKEKSIPSKLEILLNNSKSGINLEKIDFTETKNYISFKNLKLSEDLKIQSVDKVNVNFLNNNGIKNNFRIKRNPNNYTLIGKLIDGEKIVERLLNSNNKNKVSSLFDNINTSLILNLDRIYLEKNEYLKKFEGELDIKDKKLFLAKINASLKNKNKFNYSYRTTNKNEKITNIFIEKPRPFINNYKFIKGFEEGELKLNSIKIDNTSRSNLKITNFKVKEVPILAKILTLASLQGVADLLTGEGIRFDEFEMDFKTKSNLTEIDEMYAIGPAISIMMEGYVEKDRITSLRGTLVPATTINKTISKIPLLGEILVGTKSGEGVFGVSFKVKGPPNNLKSTVNPIKTLTPRFITRTLEKIKGN